MFDEIETIDRNPKSWAAWKREAERLQKIIDEMTTNHPANGPVSLDRLHQISEILRKAASQSDGGNLCYAMADAVKVIGGAIARELVRREHAIWSQTTFGDVGPVGPLKHLSKEALEAAAEPGDLSEWADMQFLLWDAQRRAGISDEQITQAMVEKLAVNKQREWPEPKDGEPRLHIKAQPAPAVADIDIIALNTARNIMCDINRMEGWPGGDVQLLACIQSRIEQDYRAAMLQGVEPVTQHDELPLDYLQGHKDGLEWAARLAEANHPQTGDWLYDDPIELAKAIRKGPDMPEGDGNSPVTPDGWIPVSERMPESDGNYWGWWSESKRQGPVWFIKSDLQAQFQSSEITHWMPLPAAPQQEVKS